MHRINLGTHTSKWATNILTRICIHNMYPRMYMHNSTDTWPEYKSCVTRRVLIGMIVEFLLHIRKAESSNLDQEVRFLD